MIKVKVILTEDQYDVLIEQLKIDIEASGDIDDIKQLMNILKTLEEDYENMEDTDDK